MSFERLSQRNGQTSVPQFGYSIGKRSDCQVSLVVSLLNKRNEKLRLSEGPETPHRTMRCAASSWSPKRWTTKEGMFQPNMTFPVDWTITIGTVAQWLASCSADPIEAGLCRGFVSRWRQGEGLFFTPSESTLLHTRQSLSHLRVQSTHLYSCAR